MKRNKIYIYTKNWSESSKHGFLIKSNGKRSEKNQRPNGSDKIPRNQSWKRRSRGKKPFFSGILPQTTGEQKKLRKDLGLIEREKDKVTRKANSVRLSPPTTPPHSIIDNFLRRWLKKGGWNRQKTTRQEPKGDEGKAHQAWFPDQQWRQKWRQKRSKLTTLGFFPVRCIGRRTRETESRAVTQAKDHGPSSVNPFESI